MKLYEIKSKVQDYKSKTEQELQTEMKQLKSELFKLRFQLATNQLENPMRLKEVKHLIARVKTEIKLKEMNSK